MMLAQTVTHLILTTDMLSESVIIIRKMQLTEDSSLIGETLALVSGSGPPNFRSIRLGPNPNANPLGGGLTLTLTLGGGLTLTLGRSLTLTITLPEVGWARIRQKSHIPCLII